MACNCRYPINCYNDKTRYKTLFVFHFFDLIFTIIRLILLSIGISKNLPNTKQFLIPILLFDLIGSIPLIICNIFYIIMRHAIQPLVHKQTSLQCLWHFATMTCIRLNLHNERPQMILLIRIIFIICSFILRFICFIIGLSCSGECTAYTVIAGVALVSNVFVIIVEFVHFFRLWTYNPTETRITKTHRRHLRFIHHSLLNDQNADGFRDSRCKQGIDCKSRGLHHHLFYHSLESKRDIDSEILNENLKKSFIAFYQTNKQEALNIAQNGFPYGDHTKKNSKDYLRLKSTIFFTPSCTQNVSSDEAIICVRLNLGRVKTIDFEGDPNLGHLFGRADGTCDTVYVKNKQRFYLRMPGQVEKWIIAINASVPVNDRLDGTFYQPCL
jgi:hypothetical protein